MAVTLLGTPHVLFLRKSRITSEGGFFREAPIREFDVFYTDRVIVGFHVVTELDNAQKNCQPIRFFSGLGEDPPVMVAPIQHFEAFYQETILPGFYAIGNNPCEDPLDNACVQQTPIQMFDVFYTNRVVVGLHVVDDNSQMDNCGESIRAFTAQAAQSCNDGPPIKFFSVTAPGATV